MIGFPAWVDVKETIRLQHSYRDRCRAFDQRSRGKPHAMRGRGVTFAIAALPWIVISAVVALCVVAGNDWGFLVAWITIKTRGEWIARIDVFTALRMPSRRATLTARIMKELPFLVAGGLAMAAAYCLRLSEIGIVELPAVAGFAGACVLLPIHLMVRKLSQRIWDKTPHAKLPLTVLLCGFSLLAFVASLRPLRSSLWGTLFVIAAVQGNVRVSRFARGIPRVLADAVWFLLLLSPNLIPPAAIHALPEPAIWIAAAYLVAYPLAAIPAILRETFKDADCMDVTPATASAPGSTEPVVVRSHGQPRPGRGLWRASWERWWMQETPPRPTGSRRQRSIEWVLVPIAWTIVVARPLVGPGFAVLAVLAHDPPVSLFLAALAALLARTFVEHGRSERLFLLGVDYAEQVRHELRALLLVACPPTLVAALVAAATRGFTDHAALGCSAVAAFLSLRVGLRGFDRWRIGIAACASLVVALIALGVFPDALWIGWSMVATAAALGTVGAVLRFRRRETAWAVG